MTRPTVCVTGACGFIAQHLVRQLLQQGYNVRGTVQSLKAPVKPAVQTLLNWQSSVGADRFKLFEADLLRPGSFNEAVENIDGCFHVASPFKMAGLDEDPTDALITPAIKGTEEVLHACAQFGGPSMRRVVLTSSFAAILDSSAGPNAYLDERNWNNSSKANKENAVESYWFSKTEAERAAWRFFGVTNPEDRAASAKQFSESGYNFDLVTICPSLTLGPHLTDGLQIENINQSSAMILNMVNGSATAYPTGGFAYVHVDDVCTAHRVAFENADSYGRYSVSALYSSWEEPIKMLKQAYPHLPIPTETGAPAGIPGLHDSWTLSNSKSLRNLPGMQYADLPAMLKDQVDYFIQRGWVSSGPSDVE